MSNLSWTEPESAANTDYPPQYPYNNVQQTEAGHSFEMDDTPGRERVRLQHRYGSFIELHPNGDEVHKIMGKGFEIIASDKNVLIKGVCNITIEGDSVLHVKGDSYNYIEGIAYQTVEGSVRQLVNGTCQQTIDGDYDINVSGDVNINASNVNLNADLNVRGDIGSTQSVSAKGNINAGVSVSATKSVETTGYMVAGTTMVAGVSVYGPEVSDIFGSMELFRLKVDRHRHYGVKGGPDISGVPTEPME